MGLDFGRLWVSELKAAICELGEFMSSRLAVSEGAHRRNGLCILSLRTQTDCICEIVYRVQENI